MHVVSKVIRIELSAIFLMAALLLLSAGGLVGRAVVIDAAVRYPYLYANPVAEFITPTEKTVYFTFDDGPSRNTEKVLDVLKEQNVKATFFVTAQKAGESYTPVLLKRMVNEGHTIGLHSYTHEVDQLYKSVDSYLEDISKLNDYIFKTVGIRPTIYRFPGGSATAHCTPSIMKAIITEMNNRGYQYYDWHVVSGDDTVVYSSETLAKRMIKGCQGLDQAVILLHDSPTAKTSAQAVNLAIDQLREQGYSFDRLTPEVEPVHIKTNR